MSRVMKFVAALAVAAGAATVAPTAPANAVPIRTQDGWSVLACRFRDVAEMPQSTTYLNRMFGASGAGTGGLYDWFRDQSYGKVNLKVTVRGWYTMPLTRAQLAGVSRWDKINSCVQTAARNGYNVPAGHRIVVLTNAQQDSGASGGRVLLDPGAWNPRFAAHEMLHGYDLGHSFSNDLTYQNASWSQPGEYDDMWDQMSAQHVYSTAGTYGQRGTGLNAFHRDKLGWIPKNRVTTFGANGVSSATVSLAPLNVPAASGAMLVRVPFNPGDLFNYYTVEYQRRLGFSDGIPSDTVLIHEVRNGRTTLLRNLSAPGKPPAQSLNANGVSINVSYRSGNLAQVRISSNITSRCVQGYVWREARAGDLVCVTGAVRSQTAYDNSVRATRWVNGAYGPHTCRSGFVWREAFAGDDVCVYPSVRSQAWADNGLAASRRNPARLVFGPNTCKSGYVWREADLSDYVCVTGAVRSQTAYDNSVRTSRWVSGAYGAHTCRSGFVWREAFAGDDVCVYPSVRTQAWADNGQVAARVLRTSG